MKFRVLVLLGFGACSMQLPMIPGMGNNAPASVCGDGVVGAGEGCDDGNLVDFDACTSACTNAGCGDGVTRRDLTDPLDPGYEACDDGNDRDDDGCTNACLSPKCGDGRVFQSTGVGGAGYEQCDDGNTNNNDSCTADCLVARCGDGFIRNQVGDGDSAEACDDGNAVDLDGCRNNCQIARCGDGAARADIAPGAQRECSIETDCVGGERCLHGRCYPIGFERCDDGNDDDLDACLSGCVSARCGDGVVRTDLAEGEAGYEVCDDGNTIDSDGCNGDCQPARCGDGVRRDDLDARVRGPSALCTFGCQDQEVCVGGVCLPVGYEACDDGNLNNSDACVECKIPGSSASSAARSCLQLINQGQTESGVYWLDVDGPDGELAPSRFYCDQTTDGGGWIHLMGPNAAEDSLCDWLRFSEFQYENDDREAEAAIDPDQWDYQCAAQLVRLNTRPYSRLELRITLETPFNFTAVRYDARFHIATYTADGDIQRYMAPSSDRRHPIGQPISDDAWTVVRSCQPFSLNDTINPFTDNGTMSSLSWLIQDYSPANGCVDQNAIEFQFIAVR